MKTIIAVAILIGTSVAAQSGGPTMKAIMVRQWGGPEVLKLEDVPVPTPKEDQMLIKVFAARDWIHWIVSAKLPETRRRRIKNACSMLAAGKRRVCCFDRSGFYSKSLSAPKAAS